jgi:hypothetical protein
VQVIADSIEQPLSAAEQYWHEADLHLVHQICDEILL